MIAAETIDAVRDLPIDQVIGRYVELKRAGSSLRAPSPFTEERTPSFFVVPSKGLFKCFSTGKGGDHITFVIEKFGVSFVDAIKMVATDFNIELKYDDNGYDADHHDKLELLYKINHAVANQYSKELQQIFAWPIERSENDWRMPVYHELIERRKFTHDTILQWRIGYAPTNDALIGAGFTPKHWTFLAKTLISKGYHEQGEALGLIKVKEGVTYDTFRNRIMYPIMDHRGRYVSFGGRALKHDEYNAKYLNGTNSPIYDKSKVLYGLNYAAAAIRESGWVNVMEGYTDVISFHQAGITNTIGTCGTALTDDQCKLLRKYTNNAVLFYDSDEAGQKASLRAIDLLMANGFLTSVVPMPSLVTLKPGSMPWQKQPVFITHRDNETITVKTSEGEIELPLNDVHEIEKVDPDELVRMLC